MFSTLLLSASAVFLPQTPGGPQPQGVVINEFSYDDTGSDDLQFVEIYNGSGQVVDLTGWTLVGEEGSSSGAPNGSRVITAGTILLPGQFWVVGEASVPNVNQSLGGLALENGPDGLILVDPLGIVQDAVCWEYASWTMPVPLWLEGDGLGGDIQLHEHVGNFNSISRCVDGVDTDDNGCDFRSAPWTPGTFNLLGVTTLLPYQNNFDDAVGSTVDADFTYSFRAGNTVDPAAVTVAVISGIPQAPQVFPPSPQGGNISIWHDPSGGGNANWLKNPPTSEYLMEAYVYLRGPNAAFAPTDGENWTFGVRGMSDSFGEPADVGGYHSLISCSTVQSGHTGIAWVCNRTQLLADLYLVDFNNGGGDFTILAGPIAIQPGVNDGWQRLRICTTGADVVGNIGGTLGCDDGQRFTASGVSVCNNGMYLTYRECVTDNNNMTPLMLDALTITASTTATANVVGTGSATTAGIPTIGSVGVPSIGNFGFTITGANMVPNSNPFAVMVVSLGGPLPGLQIPGAPIGALQYASPLYTAIGFADASGNIAYGLPIPCSSGFSGVQMTGQLVDFDNSLPALLPIGTSAALAMQIGQ